MFKADAMLLASKAIKNRVCVFFKNMGDLEFILYFPFLFCGGIFKIFEFHFSAFKKMIYFIPFSIFSMSSMLLSIVDLSRYRMKKKMVMAKRFESGFLILKLIFKKQ